jgi:hypothetical protein
MGASVNLFRNFDTGDGGGLNAFGGWKVTVVNVDGPFEPSLNAPAAMLVDGPGGGKIVVPAIKDGDSWVEVPASGPAGARMFGGSYAAGDSRFQRAAGGYGVAVAVHDRIEDWDTYRRMSI